MSGGSGGAAGAELAESAYIHDWNSADKRGPLAHGRVSFFDETLRDGIQSPSVVDPSIADKLRLVELANDLGIDTMDIGLPGAGKRAVEDVTTIAEHIRSQKLRVKASCARGSVWVRWRPLLSWA